jgi:hypothetical protein
MLCAALYELKILQRHLVVVGGGIKSRWHECHNWRRSGLWQEYGLKGRELVVPIVKVKYGLTVETRENRLRRKLLRRVWFKRRIRLRCGRCVRYLRILHD